MYKYQMFGILIVGSLSCLGCSRPMIYYKTITELRQMGGEAQTRHLRVGGDIQCNSIAHIAGALRFNLVQGKQVLTVEYEGRRDSLPNTFAMARKLSSMVTWAQTESSTPSKFRPGANR
jgi:cytochrome c-type biogenesis protein CcmE